MLHFSTILLSLGLIQLALGQNCRNQWTNFRNCVKNKYNDYSPNKRLDDGSRNSMENNIRQCYKNQNCFDPFPSNNEANAKRDCYRQTRDALRKELQSCIKRDYTDFDLTDDDDTTYMWLQDESILKFADGDSQTCPPNSNRAPIRECVCNKISQAFGQNNPSKKLCDVRWDCMKSQNMDQSCYDRYQGALQKVCDCSSKVDFSGYKDTYSNCLSKKQYSVSKDKDYLYKWLDNAKNRYCNSSAKLDSQCGGFNLGAMSGSGGGLGNMDLTKVASLFSGSGLGGGLGGSDATSGLTSLLSSFGSLGAGLNLGGGSKTPSSLCGNTAAISGISNLLGNMDLLKGK